MRSEDRAERPLVRCLRLKKERDRMACTDKRQNASSDREAGEDKGSKEALDVQSTIAPQAASERIQVPVACATSFPFANA